MMMSSGTFESRVTFSLQENASCVSLFFFSHPGKEDSVNSEEKQCDIEERQCQRMIGIPNLNTNVDRQPLRMPARVHMTSGRARNLKALKMDALDQR